jgi:hypothetical protein
VWLEFVPKNYIKSYSIIPVPENGQALLRVKTSEQCHGLSAEAAVSFKGSSVCTVKAKVSGSAAYFTLPIPEPVLWDIGKPNLYDLRISMSEDSVEEVYARLEGLTKTLLQNKRISAFCYTQLTDVEQEQNGIYKYDRTPKFDSARLKAIFGGKAAIEE